MQLPQPSDAAQRDPRAVASELFEAVAGAVRGAPETVRLALVAPTDECVEAVSRINRFARQL